MLCTKNFNFVLILPKATELTKQLLNTTDVILLEYFKIFWFLYFILRSIAFQLLTDEEMPFITVGLVMYVKYYLPLIDWTDQNYRPALFAVLKRLDRFFMKLSKKTHLR